MSYTDGQGTAESVTSGGLARSTMSTMHRPAGSPSAGSSPKIRCDGRHHHPGRRRWTWHAALSMAAGLRSGFVNVGTDQALTRLGDADVGAEVRVVVSYTDGQGTAESVTSGGLGPVDNVNDAPTGGVTISGIVAEDQTSDGGHFDARRRRWTWHAALSMAAGLRQRLRQCRRGSSHLHPWRRRCRRRGQGGGELHRRAGHG